MLMRLSLNTAPYPEFDFSRGATIWLGMCQRGRYNLKRPELEATEESVPRQMKKFSTLLKVWLGNMKRTLILKMWTFTLLVISV